MADPPPCPPNAQGGRTVTRQQLAAPAATWWCPACLRICHPTRPCRCLRFRAPLLDLSAPSERAHVRVRRVRGVALPDSVRCVDQSSRWRNPYVVGVPEPSGAVLLTASTALQHFLAMLRERPDDPRDWLGRPYPSVAHVREDLSGWDLADWCDAHSPCHVPTLLHIAAGGEP